MRRSLIFTSPDVESSYQRAYDEAMVQWPVPFESLFVPTSFGETHVVAAGEPSAPPLVLLHGKYASSTQWIANIAAFAERFRCYAVDSISDIGKSIPTSIPRSRAAHARWLAEVLDALQVERAQLVAISFGGFLALNFALRYPGRVAALVCMSPGVAFAPFTARWVGASAAALLFPGERTIRALMERLSVRGYAQDDPLLRQRIIGITHARPRWLPLPFIWANRLRGLEPPMMLLLGDREIMYRPHAALRSARRRLPQARVEIVRNCGHSMNRDQPEIINRLTLDFLDGR